MTICVYFHFMLRVLNIVLTWLIKDFGRKEMDKLMGIKL